MKIETNWNVGNFSLALAADMSQDRVNELAGFIIRHFGQRVTQVDKVMGAFTTDKVLAKAPKGKGPWRKKDWTRNGVPYTPEMAKALRECFLSLPVPDSDDVVPCEAQVVEYIRDTVESKFTEERAIAESIESASDTEQAAALARIKWTTGIDSIHTEDGEDYSREFLMAIRTRKLEKRKADLTAI